MRVLILGGGGMLGHKLWQMYRDHFETWVTVRTSYRDYARFELFDPQRMLGGVEAFDFDAVVRALAAIKPQVVINCIGIIKQLPTARDPIISLTVNALFPHRLANLCLAGNMRLIHISTDCVFNGRKGRYTEIDVSDAEDLYGRSKYLGEVNAPGCLTLRTSIIGRELQTTSGLVEWFLSQRGQTVKGYRRSIYSGFTTLALARVMAEIIEQQPDLSGVYQVSSEPINKYDLLHLIRREMNVPIEIEADDTVSLDRSLDSARFRSATGFTPPAWDEMVREMARDETPYEKWRS
jgi:dTDP-4-dehydrorhamnose reductase